MEGLCFYWQLWYWCFWVFHNLFLFCIFPFSGFGPWFLQFHSCLFWPCLCVVGQVQCSSKTAWIRKYIGYNWFVNWYSPCFLELASSIIPNFLALLMKSLNTLDSDSFKTSSNSFCKSAVRSYCQFFTYLFK